MNPQKPKGEQKVSAGISLDPQIKRDAKALAKKRGLTLSSFVSMLLTDLIQKNSQGRDEEKNLKHSKQADRTAGAESPAASPAPILHDMLHPEARSKN